MTRAETGGELRRSATRPDPYTAIKMPAHFEANEWVDSYRVVCAAKPAQLRWFFLLVAEALEAGGEG